MPNLKWNRNSKSDRWGAYVCVVRVKNMLCSYTVCFSFGLARTRWNSSILLLKHVPNETCTCINQCRFCFYFFCAYNFFRLTVSYEWKKVFLSADMHSLWWLHPSVERLGIFFYTLFHFGFYYYFNSFDSRFECDTFGTQQQRSNTQPHGCMFFLHAENWFTFLPMFCAHISLFFAHFRIQIEISSRNAQIAFVALTQPQQQANINLHTYSFQNETKYMKYLYLIKYFLFPLFAIRSHLHPTTFFSGIPKV